MSLLFLFEHLTLGTFQRLLLCRVIDAVQFCTDLLVLDLQTTVNDQIDLNPCGDPENGFSQTHAVSLPPTLKVVRTNISAIVKSDAWTKLPSLDYVELCRPSFSDLHFYFPPVSHTILKLSMNTSQEKRVEDLPFAKG